MISSILLAVALSLPNLRIELPAAVAGEALARQIAVVGCAALLAVAPSPRALSAAEAPPCQLSCFRECDRVAPGNREYCSRQCDSYCAEVEAEGQADVLRSDPSEAAPSAAKIAVGGGSSKQGQSDRSSSKDLGIFGDSGVSYSSGVEDLLATAFGAKRQSKPVGEADIAGFALEIGEAAKNAVLGK
mmetsp:Transcript_2205/g.4638  ORF Transcript_2205/g.4638 Transcript_2205/m.4638 type:complete len:187 (+) Transcript_2205:1-561(+)